MVAKLRFTVLVELENSYKEEEAHPQHAVVSSTYANQVTAHLSLRNFVGLTPPSGQGLPASDIAEL